MRQQPQSDIVIKSTLVLAGQGGPVKNFPSLEAVPAELRREIESAVHGELAASILLADEAGQKYLSGRVKTAANAQAAAGWRRMALRRLAYEAAAVAALALGLWMLVGLK